MPVCFVAGCPTAVLWIPCLAWQGTSILKYDYGTVSYSRSSGLPNATIAPWNKIGRFPCPTTTLLTLPMRVICVTSFQHPLTIEPVHTDVHTHVFFWLWSSWSRLIWCSKYRLSRPFFVLFAFLLSISRRRWSDILCLFAPPQNWWRSLDLFWSSDLDATVLAVVDTEWTWWRWGWKLVFGIFFVESRRLNPWKKLHNFCR